MPNRTQINVRVSPDQRDRWDDYADDLGFQSRGEMVRRAVEHFHACKTSETDHAGGVSAEQLDDMQDTLEDLRLDVADVRRRQIVSDDLDEVWQDALFVIQNMIMMRDEEDESAAIAPGLEDIRELRELQREREEQEDEED